MTRKTLRACCAFALVGGLGLGMTSCGKVSEKVGDKVAEEAAEQAAEQVSGGNVDIDTDNGDFKIKTEDGEFSTSSSNELPDSWPVEVLPVPDGFKIGNVTQTKTPEGSMKIVTTTGKADPGALIDSYVKAFESNGIEILRQTKNGQSGGSIVGKKDDVSYRVTVSGEKGSPTRMNLSVMANKTSGN